MSAMKGNRKGSNARQTDSMEIPTLRPDISTKGSKQYPSTLATRVKGMPCGDIRLRRE